MPEPGYFAAFEGIDGCGKSTAIEAVARRLRERGYRCTTTQEQQLDRPTGKHITDILRGKVPLVEPFELQKLFILDRYDHVEHVVKPAIAEGAVVLTDRYWLSTLAYGMLFEPAERFIDLHRSIMGENFLLPHLTFYLDIPADVAMERIQKSRTELTHFEKLKKLEKIRQNYLSLAASNIANIVVIDAQVPPTAVVEAVVAILDPGLHHLKEVQKEKLQKN